MQAASASSLPRGRRGRYGVTRDRSCEAPRAIRLLCAHDDAEPFDSSIYARRRCYRGATENGLRSGSDGRKGDDAARGCAAGARSSRRLPSHAEQKTSFSVHQHIVTTTFVSRLQSRTRHTSKSLDFPGYSSPPSHVSEALIVIPVRFCTWTSALRGRGREHRALGSFLKSLAALLRAWTAGSLYSPTAGMRLL